MNEKLRPALAEFIGTFIFVFMTAGSICADSFTRGAVGLIGIALTQGLTLAILISTLGSISGGHFNPAVTLGLKLAKKVSGITAAVYIVAQFLGAILAGFLLRLIFDPMIWQPVHLGAPALATTMTPLAALTLEIVMTFFLMLVVLGTVVDSMAPRIAGFGVGLTLTVAVLVTGPLTGAALNPARALGPALAAGFWEYHGIYWLAPITGALAATWLYTRGLSKTI